MSKAKKHLRPCPALGRDITPAECGEGRGSAYRCPADCPFFPFTPENYDKHAEIEDRLIQKAMARATRELPPTDRESLFRAMNDADGSNDAALANHARFAWLFHRRRDAAGRTLGERWLADKTSGLTNDERVLLAGMNEMHPALLEVHRILDEQTIEGVDLLTGRPLHIIDHGAAAAALRYATLFSWVYPMAHYDRISGAALFVVEVPPLPPEEVVREVIRHLGGPADTAGERGWLSEHFARVCAALNAVKFARWQDAMSAMDARYIKTDYRLRKGAQFSARLARRPEVEKEQLTDAEVAQGFDSAYVWLGEEGAPDSDPPALPLPGPLKVGAVPVLLGRILVGRERVRVEAMSGPRHRVLRTLFEQFAAGEIEFLGERVDDVGAQTSGGHAAKFDAALVPPRLREHPQQLVLGTQRLAPVEDSRSPTVLEIYRGQYATFADEPIPALDGQTPRAAAADPALRPRLVALMKTHIRETDRRRRGEGLDLDLNPLLTDLGLLELVSEPPPLGLQTDDLEDAEFEETAEALEEMVALSRGLGPHAVRPPLSERAVDQRLKAVQTHFPSPEGAALAVDEMFPGLLDHLFEATQSALNENEWPILEFLVVRACLVLGPHAPPAPALAFDRIVSDFAGEFARGSKILFSAKSNSAAFQRWASDSPQPVVVDDLGATLMAVKDSLRRKERPRDESVLLIMACVKAVVAELSRAGLE